MKLATGLLGVSLLSGVGALAGAGVHTYLFVCDSETAYTVRAGPDEAWLFRPEGTLRLPAVVADGAADLYSDGVFKLWIDAEQDRARLAEAGAEPRVCPNDRRRAVWERAKLDGADFRAVGNEPGWNLDVRHGQKMVLVADYGVSRVELPLPRPEMDPEAGRIRWDAGELVLEVIGRPCRDSMSGEQFEAESVVNWRGRTFRGCGRALH